MDSSSNAWVAGYTESSLDGHSNAGSIDLFLMKFDASGVHLWTAQRGGPLGEDANDLQAGEQWATTVNDGHTIW